MPIIIELKYKRKSIMPMNRSSHLYICWIRADVNLNSFPYVNFLLYLSNFHCTDIPSVMCIGEEAFKYSREETIGVILLFGHKSSFL